MFAVALGAESLAAQKKIPMAEIERRLPLGVQFLSPKETAFLRAASPEKQQIVDFCWRYEALNLPLWTLGRVPELAFPSGICDVPALAQFIVGVNEPEFVAGAGLPPAGAILDALDLQFRCHRAMRQARLDGMPAAGLEGGVVQERHYALNWLAHFENADWDAVDTPT